MGNRALHENISTVVSIAPAANRTATVNGSSADLAGYRSAVALVQFGVVTDGTWTPTIEESDDDSNWSTATAISGSFTATTSANDDTVQEVSYTGTARYIRVTVTETVASTTGALFNALIVRGDPIKAPVT